MILDFMYGSRGKNDYMILNSVHMLPCDFWIDPLAHIPFLAFLSYSMYRVTYGYDLGYEAELGGGDLGGGDPERLAHRHDIICPCAHSA
jgi:hypothetical protein